jgi:hypothetical protein
MLLRGCRGSVLYIHWKPLLLEIDVRKSSLSLLTCCAYVVKLHWENHESQEVGISSMTKNTCGLTNEDEAGRLEERRFAQLVQAREQTVPKSRSKASMILLFSENSVSPDRTARLFCFSYTVHTGKSDLFCSKKFDRFCSFDYLFPFLP